MEAIEILKKEHQRQMNDLRRAHARQSRKRLDELRQMDRSLDRMKRRLMEMGKPKRPPIVWTQVKWVFNILL